MSAPLEETNKLNENGPQILGDLGGNQASRHNGVGTSDSYAVVLSAQKDDLPVDRTSVDTSLMCGVHDIEVVVNLPGVLLTQRTSFKVSLEGLDH
jgi:hypothetical protein